LICGAWGDAEDRELFVGGDIDLSVSDDRTIFAFPPVVGQDPAGEEKSCVNGPAEAVALNA
jgi:hypothetical protein